MRAAEIVKQIAAQQGGTPAQVALAWLLQKGEDVAPIPGTKRRTYLEEDVAAADLSLSLAEMKRLDEALAAEAIAGPRYTEKQARLIDR